MKRRLWKPMKWTLWGLVSMMTIILMWLAPLAFPHPLFDHEFRAGNLNFYSDADFDTEMQTIAQEVDRRLQAIEIYDRHEDLDVFLCRDHGLYRFFARLTLVPAEVPGFNLSLADNSFLSLSLLEKRRLHTGAWPEYSAIGGEIVHTTTHELVHDCMVARLGFLTNLNLPTWKSEGYAEYAASLAARRNDPEATLSKRIEIMQSGPMAERAREYFSWTLAVEYLSEIQGLTFDEVMSTDLTFEQAHAQMMSWYALADSDT
ncbi:MAG: hypothetical protein OEV49_12485 [candidate division Zixibacteria bacterium]|nr:hypothetical protein [candidate division Zixibacteria bacterium]MDH3935907.1 hypothetical protein [candidate division Zixibacteria bacterium]MDH4035637.1 hypothetical protein [candidate division Zixibacteria bacterium]